uniref:IS256 family transposase n=1 Tax=Rickettsia endosymbiont of Urophora cardui TaxID=3066265 RepID=UPI00313EF304
MKNKNKISNPTIEKVVSEILSHSDPSEIFGQEGIFQEFKKQIVNKILEKEMETHIGYAKHSKNEKDSYNRRNGYYEKTLLDPEGRKLSIEVPRDRNGEFEPMIIPKGVRKFEGFDDKVISLYARGMTIRGIQGHLEELYATKVSSELISKVTDGILEEVTAWQNRGLDSVYPIMYLDCIHVKARDNHVIINKAVYLAIGVNMEGKKELLGIWIGKNEGAKFWMQVVTELKNRGFEQIYVACVDGLKGFPEAINSIFPKTIVQLCIVHMVRNAVKYVSYKDMKNSAASDRVSKQVKLLCLALSHQLCKFREPLNSTIKFDHKMSHSFIPIGDRHRPFFGNIINCQI